MKVKKIKTKEYVMVLRELANKDEELKAMEEKNKQLEKRMELIENLLSDKRFIQDIQEK